MTTGNEFMDALRAAIAPRTIASMKGEASGVRIILSDGFVVEVKRKRIADLRTSADMTGYVSQVLS